MKYSASKLIGDLLEALNERQREVLVGRFGLGKSGKSETLASLGARYKVTRERVRQIEASALQILKKYITQSAGCQEILERGKKELKEAGGALKADELLKFLKEIAEDLTQNQLAMLLESSKSFFFYPEDKDNWHFYALDKNSYKNASLLVDKWTALLRAKKEHVLNGKYESVWDEFVSKRGMKAHHAKNHISISKKIHRNPYGDAGLAEWSEILPRTIRDRVYLILRKKKEPMHFRNIAKAINEMFKTRSQASAPTVHNELIKDDRFVLVGRGIYALREHGYEPGTAKEVIVRILKRQGALRPKDVILAVQKERFFKPNTVLVNLQNRNHFTRKKDGTYVVREV
ncbi:MAG TPA: sigma factor-like helix-turn-helix DNA-binding protein [Candidatus Paceibacterota bacterium]